jgi:hypothetical protein
MSAEEVQASAHNNRIVDVASLRNAGQRRKEMARLSLAPLRLSMRPQPVWTEGAFLAEFGDAFLEGTGLDGGVVLSGLRITELTLTELVASSALPPHVVAAAAPALAAMRASTTIFKRMASAQKGSGLTRLLKLISTTITALQPGQTLLVPAGWLVETDDDDVIQFDIILVIEATTETGLTFAVVTDCRRGGGAAVPRRRLQRWRGP